LSEEEYNLKASIDKLGVLVPIIKDKLGNVIDGNHRLQITKDAPVFVVDIKNPQDRAIARLAINLHRRKLSSEEKTKLLKEIAELTLWSSQQIADAIGMSQNWVLKYLPEQYKDKEMAELGSKGGVESVASRREANIQEETVECERCHVNVPKAEIKIWQDHNLCERDYKNAELNPEGYAGFFKRLQMAKEGKVPTKEYVNHKPEAPDKDSWAFRDAHRKVQHSQDEMDLLNELASLGITPRTDFSICLWGCTPDGTYEDKKLCYRVMNPATHKGKRLDVDDQQKAELEKRGWNVLDFNHGEGMPKEWARQVAEALKW